LGQSAHFDGQNALRDERFGIPADNAHAQHTL
jgi:hypothetical protein